jgi:hypothetical protein
MLSSSSGHLVLLFVFVFISAFEASEASSTPFLFFGESICLPSMDTTVNFTALILSWDALGDCGGGD